MNNSREEGVGRDGGGKNGTENEGKGVSGIQWSSARRGEGANGRKRQEIAGEKIVGEEERRREGGRDRVRERGSDNERGIARDIFLGQDGLKE